MHRILLTRYGATSWLYLLQNFLSTESQGDRLPMAREFSHEWMKPFRILINVQINYLKYGGLGEIDSKPFIKDVYFVYKVWIMMAMYIFAITLFSDIFTNIDNLSIATDDGCIFSGIFVVIFSAMNHLIRHKKIMRLLDDILKCADELCEFSNVEYVKDIIETYQTRNKITFHGFSALGCVLGVALLFFSPMKNGLPIRAKYPFNTTISPWREIGLTVEICAVSGGLLAIIAIDTLMITMCSLITALFDVLNVNFENCIGMSEENKDKMSSGSDQRNILYERKKSNTFLDRYTMCIKFHQRLVFMVNDYKKTYSSSLFVQMLSSTSIICLTGFQAVVVGGQSSDILKFGIYLSAGISQLFYICWIGNELSYSSSILDKSQWLSGWHHEKLTDVAQTFALSTIFTRQPITLKAGAFYILSLETFIAIIRGSYSVFTLLNNMQTTDV